jgi:FkbM family methyltransferase
MIGRDSHAVRMLRPVYEALLDVWSLGRGYMHTVNGTENFYVAPKNRTLYPITYDVPVMDFLRERVRLGQTCLNIGANAGIYTICLAQWVGPEGRVFAFEPNPTMRRVIDDTARRSKLADRITTCPEAIGATPGSATLLVSDSTGVSRLDQPNPDASGIAHRPITVPITTIDRFCAERKVRPDWIVMDIEGYEVAALEGGRETIRAGKGRIGLVVETHPAMWEMSGTSAAKFAALLTELGLRAEPLTGQSDPIAERGIVQLEAVG